MYQPDITEAVTRMREMIQIALSLIEKTGVFVVLQWAWDTQEKESNAFLDCRIGIEEITTMQLTKKHPEGLLPIGKRNGNFFLQEIACR